MAQDLKREFTRKEWKDCCGKGCKKCKIAQSYVEAHGRSAGLARLNEDRKSALAAKSGKKKRGKKSKKSARKKAHKRKG